MIMGTAKHRPYYLFVLPALHLCFCLFIQFSDFEGSWGWFLAFLVDFPFSVLLFPWGKYFSALVCFGVFGTLWWLLLSWLLMRLMRSFSGESPLKSKWLKDKE
jgi:hypothetical protein